MKESVLITGGAGFIGTNLAARLIQEGQRVRILDNLSRPGVERNLEWLQSIGGGLLDFEEGDIRNSAAVRQCVRNIGSVFHFAAQTAVTTSLTHPRQDFEVNALGTLTLLEELRLHRPGIPVVFTSTNKVYGKLEKIAVRLAQERYEPQHPGVLASGIDESWPLDFHSPYGCSKGAADQYVLDYARSFGMPNVVFRMSCIYGLHQCGNEDQGWVAHFLIQSLLGRSITIFGDGRQVRDALFADDLVEALLLASSRSDSLSGCAFNIGGGVDRTISLLELVDLIEHAGGQRPRVRFEDWRVGDQRYYVSDTSAFTAATGWTPRVSVAEGVSRLFGWLQKNHRTHALGEANLKQGVA
ncbi:MAG TPA: NAD-dependent epimerase/dehydratase family protein [Bryobacteraceae bacterium]|nr:NAD-dependent epimerase/dehydratase family protein [Bryobacteraceae bacterium]